MACNLKEKAMKLNIKSGMLEVADHALGPALQCLRQSASPSVELVDVYFGAALRQTLENWGNPKVGLDRLEEVMHRSLRENETDSVNKAFDKAFETVFPDLTGMGRGEASLYVRRLVEDVCVGFRGAGGPSPEDREHLQAFLKEAERRLEACPDFLELTLV